MTLGGPTAPPPPAQVPPRLGREDSEPAGDASRTGALWLGIAGVAMLLASAAVLTAVRWDDIGQTAKLGGLVAITLAMIFGGRRLQAIIPLTGRAIFHLGALLIPLDMAAVAILAERTWQQSLLMTSFTAVVAWTGLFRVDPSPVLRWSAIGSIPLLAAGIAAVTPVGFPLVLVIAAAAAARIWVVTAGSDLEASPHSAMVLDAATAWALLAGIAPMSAFIDWPARISGAAGDLGLNVADRWQLIVASVLAVMVSGELAVRRPSLWRGWCTLVIAAAAAIAASASSHTAGADHFAAALLFLVIELALLAMRGNTDWDDFRRRIDVLPEVFSGVAFLGLLLEVLLVGPPLLGAAAAVHVLGWLTADRRRLLEPNDWLVGLIYGSGWFPASVAVTGFAIAGALAVDARPTVVAVVSLACGAWSILTSRDRCEWIVAATTVFAAAIAPGGWWSVVLAAAGLALATGAARFHDAHGRSGTSFALAFTAMYPAAVLIAEVPVVGPEWLMLPIGAAVMWLTGVASAGDVRPAGWVGRLVGAAFVGIVWDSGPYEALAVCGVVFAASVAEWIYWHRPERRRPNPASDVASQVASVKRAGRGSHGSTVGFEVAAAMSLVLAAVPVARLLGFGDPEAGLIMVGVGVVATGLVLAVPRMREPRWYERPLGVLAATATIVGVAQAAPSAGVFAPALLLAAASVGLYGLAVRSRAVLGVAGIVGFSGWWLQLAIWRVDWLEAYLAGPALVALWLGWEWHREIGTSTWVTHAPSIAIFGGLAFAERLLGGSAWHSVIAGGVAVVAVVVGAVFRLVGPLVTGTALIAAVVVYEVLGTGAEVPTWAWLAGGGTALLGSAILLERSESSPLEQGQRVVQVLKTRYR